MLDPMGTKFQVREKEEGERRVWSLFTSVFSIACFFCFVYDGAGLNDPMSTGREKLFTSLPLPLALLSYECELLSDWFTFTHTRIHFQQIE